MLGRLHPSGKVNRGGLHPALHIESSQPEQELVRLLLWF
jgi:hypothetical protein